MDNLSLAVSSTPPDVLEAPTVTLKPPKTEARIPVWFAYALVIVVGASALLVSAYYLWMLAVATAMPIWLAWSLPVALDAAAAGATACWVAGQKEARKWGRGIALVALAGTMAGNSISHLIGFGLMKVTLPLVLSLGAVYPAAVWGMVHLALVLRAEEHDRAVTAYRHKTRRPRKAGSSNGKASPADRRKWIADRLDAGIAVTGSDVEHQFGSKNGCSDVEQVKVQRIGTLVGVS